MNNNNSQSSSLFAPQSQLSPEFIYYKQQYLKFRLNMPLDLKIEYSLNRIKQFYKHYNGDVYVAFSGGKDSVVLLDLVRSIYPKVMAVFSDTGVEFPEIKDFIKSSSGNSNSGNLIVIRPHIKFNEILKEYGYPVVSKEQAQYIREVRENGRNSKIGVARLTGNKHGYGKISDKWQFLIDAPFKVSEKCCKKLKKEPFKVFNKVKGVHPFVGLTASESILRKSQWVQNGCNVYGGKGKNEGSEGGVSRPLMFWKECDIWEYIKRKGLKLAKVYNMGYLRTGCIYCGFGIHLETQNEGINRFERLKVTHNKLWEYAIRDSGLGLGKVFDYCGLEYGRKTQSPLG